MAGREPLTVQNVVRSGLSHTTTAADTTDGNSFPNDGRTFIRVVNDTAGAVVVTIQTPGEVDGQAIGDRTVSLTATTGDKMIGPFPPAYYNQSDGSVYVDVDDACDIGAFRLKG